MFLATLTKKKGPILSYLADARNAEGFERERRASKSEWHNQFEREHENTFVFKTEITLVVNKFLPSRTKVSCLFLLV